MLDYRALPGVATMSGSIQLTEEQRQAVEAQQGRPIQLVDPVTNRVYVLVAAEAYDRVGDLLEFGAFGPKPGSSLSKIPAGTRRSMEAFWRDLPQLLRLRSRKRLWAAYHGDERIGLGRTQTELYQECLRRGLQDDQFYVGRLEPAEEPPWATVYADRGLWECDNIVDYPVPRDGKAADSTP